MMNEPDETPEPEKAFLMDGTPVTVISRYQGGVVVRKQDDPNDFIVKYVFDCDVHERQERAEALSKQYDYLRKEFEQLTADLIKARAESAALAENRKKNQAVDRILNIIERKITHVVVVKWGKIHIKTIEEYDEIPVLLLSARASSGSLKWSITHRGKLDDTVIPCLSEEEARDHAGRLIMQDLRVQSDGSVSSDIVCSAMRLGIEIPDKIRDALVRTAVASRKQEIERATVALQEAQSALFSAQTGDLKAIVGMTK